MTRTNKVLIVDDAESIRMFVRTTLAEAGLSVVAASNGVEAFTLARQEDFDLVITDFHMPEMDGLNLIEKLRELPNYRTIPILVLTMANTDHAKSRGKLAGATGWITKPISPPSLLGLLTKLGLDPAGPGAALTPAFK